MRCLIFLGETINGDRSIAAALRYAKDGAKTHNGTYIETIRCSKQNTEASMEMIKNLHRNHGNREYKHFVQSFAPGEDVSPEQVLELGKRTASFFDGHACLVAYHCNTPCPHYHCVVSNINLNTGKKLSLSPSIFRRFWAHSIKVYGEIEGLPQGVSSERMSKWMKFLKKTMLGSDTTEELLEIPEDMSFYPDMLIYEEPSFYQDWHIDDYFSYVDEIEYEDNSYDSHRIKPIIYLPQKDNLICPIRYIDDETETFIHPIEYIDLT